MPVDKMLMAGSTGMLLMKLLEEEDMYGYQMIEQLRTRSNNVFEMKAGTLYPLLHQLEQQGLVTAYEQAANGGRTRRYYRLTPKGKARLTEREKEWRTFSSAIEGVLEGVPIVCH